VAADLSRQRLSSLELIIGGDRREQFDRRVLPAVPDP
jgi:hypothetical protein